MNGEYIKLVEELEIEDDFKKAAKQLLKKTKGKPKGYVDFLKLAVKGDFLKANKLVSKVDGAGQARTDMIDY